MIPELNFTCSGTITGLLLGVDVKAIDDNDIDEYQYPELQIWREYQGLSYYDYYRKTRTTIAPKGGDFSPDGVLQHNLTAPIQFQSGDVLGVYQPREFNSVARLFYAYDTNAPVSIVKYNNYNSVHYSSGSTRSNQYVLIFPIIGTSPLINTFNFTYNYTDPPECTSNAFLTPEELRQKALEVNINSVVVRDQQQRVLPDITFTCNGSITKWIVGAGTGGGSSPPSELQIWRRSGSNYTKVGSTQLTAQSPNIDDPNVYEYIPSPPLGFQEGDILGVYQRDYSGIVPYYQENTGPKNLRQDGRVNAAPVYLTAPSLAAEYDYPLVTVEISEHT